MPKKSIRDAALARLQTEDVLDAAGRLARPDEHIIAVLEYTVARLLERFPPETVAALLDLHAGACRKAAERRRSERGRGAPKGLRSSWEARYYRQAIFAEERRRIMSGQRPNWRAVARDLKAQGVILASVERIYRRLFFEKQSWAAEPPPDAPPKGNALAALLKQSPPPKD